MPDQFETGMTVREMIEFLQDMPQEAIVIYEHYNCDMDEGENNYEYVRRVLFNVRKIYGTNSDVVELRVR